MRLRISKYTIHIFVFFIFIICIASSAFAENATCSHYNHSFLRCDPIDNEHHITYYKCDDCGKEYATGESTHLKSFLRYEPVDDTFHKEIYICLLCEIEIIGDSMIKHSTDPLDDSSYEKLDENYHYIVKKCKACGQPVKKKNGHLLFKNGIAPGDSTHHIQKWRCEYCGDIIEERIPHTFQKGYPKKVDNTYHADVYSCECGKKQLRNKSKHILSYSKTIKPATLFSLGSAYYTCSSCYAQIVKNTPVWKLGSAYSCSYDVDTTKYVYKNSKSVTVKMKRALKGSILKVKIGKKTYKKKIKNNKTKIKLKIKKPKVGSKIKIQLFYKGRLVGQSEPAYVYYAGDIRRGMTKDQVRYVPGWEEPKSTSYIFGGWTYWEYSDGSYIIFKNGRVNEWEY